MKLGRRNAWYRDDVDLIVDSFAGGGGASCGIEMALGRSPDVAALVAANCPDLAVRREAAE